MQNEQLTTYIRQCLNQGMQPGDIRSKLIQGGWQQILVDTTLAQLGYVVPTTVQQPTASDPRRVQKGVLWILSPYILLFVIALLQLVVRFALQSGTGTDVELETELDTEANTASLVASLINIFSILAGLVAVILIPVGFIIGIIKITKK